MGMTQGEGREPGVADHRRGSSDFVIRLEAYRGPLGLLLDLVRAQDIDIFDIPVARIANQFLETVRRSKALELDDAGEFLEMAAMLLRIKASMLLPSPDDTKYEDPRAELVRRLLEYEQVRQLSQRLRKSETDRARLFPKGRLTPRTVPNNEEPELKLTWDEILEAARNVTGPPELRRPQLPVATVADKVDLVARMLEKVERLEFRVLVEGFKGDVHVAVTLLACLEMARGHRLRLRQADHFASLWVYPRSGPKASSGIVEA